MLERSVAGALLAAGLVLAPLRPAAQAPHAAAHHGPVLGEVHFPVTCTPQAQTAFDEGMKLQHSFWYQAAHRAFDQALARDPSCVMAYWGKALALLSNPFTPPVAANLREAGALLEQARRVGAKSEREAAYIAALSTLFAGDDVARHRARIADYERAMAGLHERFPEDPEAAILHALALVMAADAADKTYANQLAAAAILERELARQPQHPGVTHYLIHATDVPSLAPRGLAAAERYAAIAADAPHALHMPSHIFTRVGRWDASIDTNRRSADAARARDENFDAVHAMDYMVYAYLQTGRPGSARRVITELGPLGNWTPDRPLGGYALAAMPARYALERGDWAAAAALSTRRFGVPYVDAVTHFARATGAARSGRPAAAAADIEALRAAAAALQGRDAYWHEQVEIQRIAAEAWVAFAGGDRGRGLALMGEAAEREARTEKHPVTPGPLSPAREQLAEMLLLAGRPADAQREFEAVARSEPRRFRSVYGAARSAELAGDRAAARRRYAELLDIAAKAEPGRPELATARSFLARR